MIKEAELTPYWEAEQQLIPLHRWDYTDERNRARGKSPRDMNWVVREYEEEEMRAHVDAGGNIGLRLRADQIMIDIDPKHPDADERTADGLEADLELELGIDLSKFPSTITGSGGKHIGPMTKPPGKLREKLAEFGGAIEFKAFGRQLVTAGSRHPNGRYYEWDRMPNAQRMFDQPCPPELLAALARKNKALPTEARPDDCTPQELDRCLRVLDVENFTLYDDWRNLMFSCHDAVSGSEEGMEVFIAWSVQGEGYEDHDDLIRQMWVAADVRDAGVTARTLFGLVGGAIPPADNVEEQFEDLDEVGGEEEGRDRRQTPWRYMGPERARRIDHKLTHNTQIAIQELGYSFSYNELVGEYIDDATKQPVDDATLAHIGQDISERWGISWSGDPTQKSLDDAVTWTARRRRFHPIRDYLSELEWDGTLRLDDWLIRVCGAPDNEYTRAVGCMILEGAVSRVYEPGIKFDTMLVLEGFQGQGKSSLVKKLGGEWTQEGMPPLKHAGDKDVIATLRGKWFVEVDELAGTRKEDAAEMKAFLSRTEDRARFAYARRVETVKRSMILIATLNEAVYLIDQTGNRRFLPVLVTKIDLTELDRDQLFAEAVHNWRCRKGPVMLDESLWAYAQSETERRRRSDSWEEILLEYISEHDTEHTFTTECLFVEAIAKLWRDVNSADQDRLARTMQSLGFVVTNVRDPSGIEKRGWKRTRT